MEILPPDFDPRQKVLLGSLPDEEYARIVPGIRPVALDRGTVLEAENEEIEHVYFPVIGMASIVALGADGESVDAVMIGQEGMTGLAVFLGTGQMPVRTVVQIPLVGSRLSSSVLRDEVERGGRLVSLLQRYTQVVMVSMAQLILCNRAHSLERRAARWLLQVHERVRGAPFDVTQEFVAEMVGVQRPSLSVVVRQFKERGQVTYTRGQVRVLDTDGLTPPLMRLHHDHARGNSAFAMQPPGSRWGRSRQARGMLCGRCLGHARGSAG